jgi:hypothetical protein
LKIGRPAEIVLPPDQEELPYPIAASELEYPENKKGDPLLVETCKMRNGDEAVK